MIKSKTKLFFENKKILSLKKRKVLNLGKLYQTKTETMLYSPDTGWISFNKNTALLLIEFFSIEKNPELYRATFLTPTGSLMFRVDYFINLNKHFKML